MDTFKRLRKFDLKILIIKTDEWELLANLSAKWQSHVLKRLKERENNTLRKRSRQRNENQNKFYLFRFCLFKYTYLDIYYLYVLFIASMC